MIAIVSGSYGIKYSRLADAVKTLRQLPAPKPPIVAALKRQLEQTYTVYDQFQSLAGIFDACPKTEQLTANPINRELQQTVSQRVGALRADWEHLKSYRDQVIQPRHKQYTLFSPIQPKALPPASQAFDVLSATLKHSQQVAADLLALLKPPTRRAVELVQMPGPVNRQKNTNSAQKMRRAYLEGRPINQNGMTFMPNHGPKPPQDG